MISRDLKSIGVGISLVAASIQASHGVVMALGSNPQDYRDYGAGFANQDRVVAFRVLSDGINPAVLATATPINSRYLITNAHLVTGILGNRNYEVSLGSNINSPTVTLQISNVFIYPSYDGTRNTPDLAILEIATPYAGFQQATFGSASPGDIITSAGYGFAMRPGDAIPTAQDGYAYGWNSLVYNGTPNSSSNLLYDRTIFFNGTYGVDKDGMLLGGDSGSPTWNISGNLVGLNTAQSGGISGLGQSIYLSMSLEQEHTKWVQSITTHSATPGVVISLTTATTELAISNLIPSREYRIMRSVTLSGWQESHRFVAATSTNTWSEATVPGGTMYYRLEWNE